MKDMSKRFKLGKTGMSPTKTTGFTTLNKKFTVYWGKVDRDIIDSEMERLFKECTNGHNDNM